MQSSVSDAKNLFSWQFIARLIAGPDLIRQMAITDAQKRLPANVVTHRLPRKVLNLAQKDSSMYASTKSILSSALGQLKPTSHEGIFAIHEAEVLELVGGNRTIHDLCKGLQVISSRLEAHKRGLEVPNVLSAEDIEVQKKRKSSFSISGPPPSDSPPILVYNCIF
jgi:hypothetical protein